MGDPLPHPETLECAQGTPTGFSDGTNAIRVRWGAHWVPTQPRTGEPGVRYQHLQGPLGRPLGARPAQDRRARRQIPTSSGSIGAALFLLLAKARHNQSSHLHNGVELFLQDDWGSAPSPESPRDLGEFCARGTFSSTGRGKRRPLACRGKCDFRVTLRG